MGVVLNARFEMPLHVVPGPFPVMAGLCTGTGSSFCTGEIHTADRAPVCRWLHLEQHAMVSRCGLSGRFGLGIVGDGLVFNIVQSTTRKVDLRSSDIESDAIPSE